MKEPEGATLDTVYRPVWEVDRAEVDLFYAKPILRDASGDEIPGARPLARRQTVESTAKRQVKYLRQAFEAFLLRLERGDDFRLMVRVSTVAVATSEAASLVTDTFRMLNKDQRKKVVVEITDFPETLSVVNMDDITIPFMPFFDHLVARPNQGMTDYTMFANLNYAGVSLDLGDKPIDLKLAGKVLRVFAERAEFRRLPMWVLGLPSAEVAKVARIAQASALSGAYMDMDSLLPGPATREPQPFMM